MSKTVTDNPDVCVSKQEETYLFGTANGGLSNPVSHRCSFEAQDRRRNSSASVSVMVVRLFSAPAGHEGRGWHQMGWNSVY